MDLIKITLVLVPVFLYMGYRVTDIYTYPGHASADSNNITKIIFGVVIGNQDSLILINRTLHIMNDHGFDCLMIEDYDNMTTTGIVNHRYNHIRGTEDAIRSVGDALNTLHRRLTHRLNLLDTRIPLTHSQLGNLLYHGIGSEHYAYAARHRRPLIRPDGLTTDTINWLEVMDMIQITESYIEKMAKLSDDIDVYTMLEFLKNNGHDLDITVQYAMRFTTVGYMRDFLEILVRAQNMNMTIRGIEETNIRGEIDTNCLNRRATRTPDCMSDTRQQYRESLRESLVEKVNINKEERCIVIVQEPLISINQNITHDNDNLIFRYNYYGPMFRKHFTDRNWYYYETYGKDIMEMIGNISDIFADYLSHQ